MKKTACILFLSLILTGCSLFPKAAPQLAKAVLRQEVNEAIQPNQVCVKCAEDAGSACLAQP